MSQICQKNRFAGVHVLRSLFWKTKEFGISVIPGIRNLTHYCKEITINLNIASQIYSN